jgi:hypothetical protein
MGTYRFGSGLTGTHTTLPPCTAGSQVRMYSENGQLGKNQRTARPTDGQIQPSDRTMLQVLHDILDGAVSR